MSRFEPNVEPSMEEILASIRRIIAEDTSGSRTPAQPSQPLPSLQPTRPNAGVRPVTTTQQRGFMSRETFMRTSGPSQAPSEQPANQRYFTPVTPQDLEPAKNPIVEKTPSPTPRKDDKAAPAEPVAAPLVAEKPEVRKEEAKPVAPEASVIETETIIEVEQKLLAAPEAITSESKSSEPKSAELKSLQPEAPESKSSEVKSAAPKSTAETIDAQLVELLNEDLKAVRDQEPRQVDKAPENRDAGEKVSAPEIEPPQSLSRLDDAAPPSAIKVEKTPATSDSNDPFVFDLGPSPFASRPTNDRPVEQKISIDPAPAASSRETFGPTRERAVASPQPGADRKVNGASHHRPDPARPAVLPSRSQETPPASRPTPTFAVPSVSATLGPHRRLEPLSESFKPEPQTYDYRRPEFPPAEPVSQRDYVRSAESPSEPARSRHDAMLQPAPPSTVAPDANLDISGDRTMEDAVADLLRPLLKTWLAENMPKIVERALRREMIERLLPDQKNSRD